MVLVMTLYRSTIIFFYEVCLYSIRFSQGLVTLFGDDMATKLTYGRSRLSSHVNCVSSTTNSGSYTYSFRFVTLTNHVVQMIKTESPP